MIHLLLKNISVNYIQTKNALTTINRWKICTKNSSFLEETPDVGTGVVVMLSCVMFIGIVVNICGVVVIVDGTWLQKFVVIFKHVLPIVVHCESSPKGHGIIQSIAPFNPQKLLKLHKPRSFDLTLKHVKPGVVHSEFRPFGQNSEQFTLNALDPQRLIIEFAEVGIVVDDIAVELGPVVDSPV